MKEGAMTEQPFEEDAGLVGKYFHVIGGDRSDGRYMAYGGLIPWKGRVVDRINDDYYLVQSPDPADPVKYIAAVASMSEDQWIFFDNREGWTDFAKVNAHVLKGTSK
jgi:hypothetical protein